MYLVSLHEDSNANITIFEGNRILFSVAEERLTRERFKGGFPAKALEKAFQELELSPDRIDSLVCGNKFHFLPRILGAKFPTFEHPFLGTSQKISLLYQHFLFRDRLLKSTVERFNASLIKRFLGKRPEQIVDHHHAHAYSAYFTSGYENALAVTTDNYGDGFASCVFDCFDGRCRLLYGSSALHSPGQFYGEVAQILGFHPLLAGKMTGLAAYGDPNPAYEIMERLFQLDDSKEDFRLPPLLFKSSKRGPYARLKHYRKEDVAAAAQKRLEDVMISYVEHAVRKSGRRDVVLAGGVFANVRLNQKIYELDGVDRVFVHPAMSDQGISMGAALMFLSERNGLRPFELQHVYLGPEFDDSEAKEALDSTGLSYERRDDLADFLAERLARGKLVGLCRGRMEYGPRALGNRSILYQATEPDVQQSLNRRLRRSVFMPFAPVTLSEHASDCYLGLENARYTARFMTMAFHCTDTMKRLSPAVVHVDGTARPQILTREENPLYYDILESYFNLTGIPSLINTSFNLHEEPIVYSPMDALRSMKIAGLDYVLIGNYLIKNPDPGKEP